MWQIIIGLVFLVLHIACCVLIYLGIKAGLIKTKKYMMFAVIFVPVFGPLAVVFLHFQIILKASGEKEVGVEKLKVNEALYHTLMNMNEESQKEVVPLEEALIINDPGLRRNLIMDVLNDNPEDYLDLLHQARMNEDVEVVHYATTAMSELFKEYDAKLQQLEQTYAKDPDNRASLIAYCDFLGEYIGKNVVQGQMEQVHREQYSRLLKKMLSQRAELVPCIHLVENQLVLKEYDDAHKVLELMKSRWSEREEYWMLEIELMIAEKKGDEIGKTIETIKARNIYLSSANREKLAFWTQDSKEETKTS